MSNTNVFSKLYLCEKPIQAQHIAQALGTYQKKEGYYLVGDTCITYALGHLFELAGPENYDPQFRKWDLQHLPIVPLDWQLNTNSKTKKQLNTIVALIKKTQSIFIATDYDREGECIARNILDFAKSTKAVYRIKLNALDEDSIRYALSTPMSPESSKMMAEAAEARKRADWLVGMNLTRYFTLKQSGSFEERAVTYIGRVLVPTIALVVQRDKDIKVFKPHPFYKLYVRFVHEQSEFQATWIPPEEQSDDKRRCVDFKTRDLLSETLHREMGQVVSFKNGDKHETAPLPLDLNQAQQIASQKWGYSTKEISAALQSLYEKHRAISYPRTESRYLPSSVAPLTKDILSAFSKTDEMSRKIVLAIKDHKYEECRVFDDNKVDPAHHAIIPTRTRGDMTRMSQIEQRLFHLVARFFCAQFFPDYIVHESSAEIEVNWARFRAKGTVIRQIGWKSVLGASLTRVDQASKRDSSTLNPLPYMKVGGLLKIADTIPEDKVTEAPKHFTEAELIAAMKNIGRFVEDESERKALDRVSGIGTAATRADIIQRAIDRQYLDRPKHRKTIKATAMAHSMINSLPIALTSPSTTAKWEMHLEQVANGVLNKDQFVKNIGYWVGELCKIEPNSDTCKAENQKVL